MLKAQGFSLLEMLISMALSSVIIVGAMSFYPQLQTEIMRYYQQFRLEQTMQNAIVGLTKDIKRAGFIANHPEKMTAKALELNDAQNCIILRYDSEIRGDWIYQPISLKDSDIFAYRYNKNNVEYKAGSLDCKGTGWEKLFDPAEIKVTHFTVKPRYNTIEINLIAELKNNTMINHKLAKIIKNENLL